MTRWADAAEVASFAHDYEAGVPEREMMRRYGKTAGQLRGKATRMSPSRPAKGEAYVLPSRHAALIEARSLFPSRVRPAGNALVLVSGYWQRKLGPKVIKGAWADSAIYSLTLQERATCPSTCHHWRSCMGNSMQWAWRHRSGAALERKIYGELVQLQEKHPNGFVVRLHILGDFYSVEYVRRWRRWLAEFPALRVFGYTAWPPSTAIGFAVRQLADQMWNRFAIRLSAAAAGSRRAITLFGADWRERVPPSTIVCPAETGRTKNCGTCGLCWSPAAQSKTIAFIAHGGRGRGKAAP